MLREEKFDISVSSFLSQTIQGYDVTDLAKWVSYQSLISPLYGGLPVSLILTQWGLESGWGGPDISTYYNPANQNSGCGVGSTCGHEPNGLAAFCSIKDGVKAYSALIINGYPHVMAAYTDQRTSIQGFNAAAQALGQGYYSNYTGGSVNYCASQYYSLTSSSGARIWAESEYGTPPGNDMITTFNANTNLQDLNYVCSTNPLPGF